MANCVENKRPCTGCGVCQAICPLKAIHLELNKEGFWTAILDKTKCIDCQKCLSVCPKVTERFPSAPDFDTLPLYAAYSQEEQETSSSGGIAAEITKWAFLNGYRVAGVRYNYKRQCAETIIAENLEQAQAFKGSKYLQSDCSNAFAQILTQTNRFVVFGAPCQIAALHLAASLTGRRKDLILVDFFCHGVPSYLLWQAFLAQQSKTIKQINFRDKTRGWHTYTMQINGNIVANNPFYDLFFSDLLLGEQCYHCESRKSFAFADIRLGDFWGSPFDLREDGVSVVCPITEQGNKILKNLSSKIKHFSAIKFHQICIKNQQTFRTQQSSSEMRRKILRILQTRNIVSASHLYQSTRPFIRRTLKQMTDYFPSLIKNILRYFYHWIKENL